MNMKTCRRLWSQRNFFINTQGRFSGKLQGIMNPSESKQFYEKYLTEGESEKFSFDFKSSMKVGLNNYLHFSASTILTGHKHS